MLTWQLNGPAIQKIALSACKNLVLPDHRIMNERAGKSSTPVSDPLRLKLSASDQSARPSVTSQSDQATSAFDTSSTGPLASVGSGDDEAGKHVVSRMHLSDKQREERERFREKEREKIKRTIQQQRAAEAKVDSI